MDLLSGFAAIVVAITAGVLLAHLKVLDAAAQQALGEVAYLVALPALTITMFSQVELGAATGNLVASAAALVVALATYAVLARLLWRPDAGSLLIGSLSAGYVNIGNIGLAVAAYVVGDITVVVPTLLVQMAIVQPASLVTLDRLTGRGRGPLRTLLRIVANPLTVATAVGVVLAVTGWPLPPVVGAPLDLLAGAAIPLMLLSYGAALRLGPPIGRSGHLGEVLLASLLKLVVMPVVAWSVAVAFGLDGPALLGVVVTAALPTAQNIFLHATRYRVGQDVSRETVAVTTLASLPVVLVIALVLG